MPLPASRLPRLSRLCSCTVQDLFRKCMDPVEKCLRDAKMDKASVSSHVVHSQGSHQQQQQRNTLMHACDD